MKIKVLVFVFLLLGMISCRKGLDSPKWDVDAYIPLITSTIKLEDSFSDSLISSDETGKLSLIYQDELISIKLDSIFSIPDTTIEDNFNIPFGQITLVPGQPIITDTQKTEINVQNIQLKKAVVRQGVIEVSMLSTIPEKTVFTYSIPAAQKNGIPLISTMNVNAGSLTSPASVSQTVDISGYELDLTGLDKNSYNQIDIIYHSAVDQNGSTIVVNSGNYIKFITSFKDVIPEYGQGYFGNETRTESGQEDSFDIFKNFENGQIAINKAKLFFTLENEVGVDITASILDISGKNTSTNNSVSLNHNITQNAINLNRASENSSIHYPPISPAIYSAHIDETNSNVTDFISNLPDELTYNIEFTTNPIGNSSNGFDFIYYNTGIVLNLDAQIPLEISANNIEIRDTAEFTIDTSSEEEANKINGGQLLLHAWNGYPLDANLQFYLMDEQYNLIDSLFAGEQLLPSGILTNQVVTESTFSTSPIPLTPAKIDRLYDTHYILIKTRISTAGYPDPVQLFDSYAIDVKLIGDFSYSIDPDNL